MIIYKITNLITKKIYIGQTTRTLAHRKMQHLQCARRGEKTKLYEAIREYGEENFKFEEIATAKSKEALNYLEYFFISKYNSVEDGYNMAPGGFVNSMFDPHVKEKHDNAMRSEEVRRKISESLRKYRQEHPFSKEHKKKLSEKAMGNHNFKNTPPHGVRCYCIDHNDGDSIHEFDSYKEGGLWWFGKYKPFGERYIQCIYQKRIVESINTGSCHYGREHREFKDVQWFKCE